MANPTGNTKRIPKPQELNLGMRMTPGPSGGGLIEKVEKWSSALKAGIQVGDEVMLWAGQKLKSFEHFVEILDAAGVGGVIKVSVLRAGKTVELNFTVPKRKTLSLDLEEVDEVLERKISP
jgi:S1-C subfamily serine protease